MCTCFSYSRLLNLLQHKEWASPDQISISFPLSYFNYVVRPINETSPPSPGRSHPWGLWEKGCTQVRSEVTGPSKYGTRQKGSLPRIILPYGGVPALGNPTLSTFWLALHAGTVRHAWTRAPAAWTVLGNRTSPHRASPASAMPLVLHLGLGRKGGGRHRA